VDRKGGVVPPPLRSRRGVAPLWKIIGRGVGGTTTLLNEKNPENQRNAEGESEKWQKKRINSQPVGQCPGSLVSLLR